MFKVISGKYKGKNLLLPNKKTTRPPKSIVREAIFSMIYFYLSKSVVLDCFAGSGSLSIEAVSRGAIKVVALENNQQVLNILQQNIHQLQIHNIEVLNRNVLDYVKNAKGLKFEIIFLDPPFKEYELINLILNQININQLLSNNGYIILHTDNPLAIKIPSKLTIQNQKKYRLSYILILTNNL